MGVIRRLDRNGDTTLATWHDEITAAKASEIFDQLVKNGAFMFRADEGTDLTGVQVKKFDVTAEQIIVVRNFPGG